MKVEELHLEDGIIIGRDQYIDNNDDDDVSINECIHIHHSYSPIGVCVVICYTIKSITLIIQVYTINMLT